MEEKKISLVDRWSGRNVKCAEETSCSNSSPPPLE